MCNGGPLLASSAGVQEVLRGRNFFNLFLCVDYSLESWPRYGFLLFFLLITGGHGSCSPLVCLINATQTS